MLYSPVRTSLFPYAIRLALAKEVRLLSATEASPPHVFVGQVRSLTTPGSALDKSLHDEKRLVHFLDRALVFAYSRGYRIDTYRPTVKFVNDCREQLVVYLVQAVLVYIERLECEMRDLEVYDAVALDLGKVSDTPQQGIGYTWRTSLAISAAASSSTLILSNLAERSRMRLSVLAS